MNRIWNKTIAISFVLMMICFGHTFAQLDDRFGAAGIEGTRYLGDSGLQWYRDWENSYLPSHFPDTGKNKIWTVGKIDSRTDGLGMDWKWILLDLLEETDPGFLDNFLDLAVAVVDAYLTPVFDLFWLENKPALQQELTDALNSFEYTGMQARIKYKGQFKRTEIFFQDAIPELILAVENGVIRFSTNVKIDWKTRMYLKAWVLNPNPFNWGYHWKSMGDADCFFHTSVALSGEIAVQDSGRERNLRVTSITTVSKTESEIDWSLLGVSFTWEALANSVDNMIDDQLEKTLDTELRKEPITSPYYLTEYFKSLFDDDVVPTQRDVISAVFEGEKMPIRRLIEKEEIRAAWWSIGYEPNWYPMLGAEHYAEIYTDYYRYIKRLDPKAKILGPPMMLTDLIEEPGEILVQLIPGLFKGLIAPVEEDLKQFIESYFKKTGTREWYSAFHAHLPPDVRPDAHDLHIFPICGDVKAMDWECVVSNTETMIEHMESLNPVGDVWITEFGNIDWRRSEEEVALICSGFCDYFKSNDAGIVKWFWFLSKGDAQLFDLPVPLESANTALLKDDFSLTKTGQVYLYAADNTPPVMTSAPDDGGDICDSEKIRISWKDALEFDSGIADYQIQAKVDPLEEIVYETWLGPVTACIVPNDHNGIMYARVRAKNGAGLVGEWSPWSDGIVIRKVRTSRGEEIVVEHEYVDNTHTSQKSTVPERFTVFQNYPNPFNPVTTILFQIPEASHVTVKIYNKAGQQVATLVDNTVDSGEHRVQWNGTDFMGMPVVSDIYFYRVTAGNFHETGKMVLAK
jgi:hypothetical protein